MAVDTGSSGSSSRRRLTTTSTGGDDDDGSSGSEIEFSDYSGEFSEAEEACESVGYVFGAPRSAYENAILRFTLSVSVSGGGCGLIDYCSRCCFC